MMKPPPSRRPLHILIVEGSAELRQLMTVILRQAGHSVEAVTSTPEAIITLDSSPFDVIVCDFSLHRNPTALALARSVRRIWPHMRFVVAVGCPDDLPI